MLSYCPACGSPRLSGAAFCARCGAGFRATDTELASQAPSDTRIAPTGADIATEPVLLAESTTPAPSEVMADAESREVGGSVPAPATPIGGGSPGPKRRVTWLTVASAALIVALLGSLGFGYSTNQSLDRTTQELAATRQILATTQSSLADTTTQLNTQTAARAQADDETGRLNNQVSDLQNQLAARDTCVAALQADEAQLQKIQREQVTQFNRSAEGSAFVKAQQAYEAALREVVNDYYNGYSAAWDGNYASANSWIDAGNSAAARASAQLKLFNAAVKTIDAGTAKVDKEEAALAQSITNTLSLCQGAAGTI